MAEIHELSRLQLLHNQVSGINRQQSKIELKVYYKCVFAVFASASMTFDRKPNGKHYAQFIFYTEFLILLLMLFVLFKLR